jgi:hypothetical protein
MAARGVTGVEERRPGWLPADDTIERHEAALAHRHASVTRIFEAVRAAVRGGHLRAATGGQSAALAALSEAFERWLNGAIANLEPEELQRRAVALTAAAVAMLEAFHGDGSR